jgi:heptaprenyl diphosphate synthase
MARRVSAVFESIDELLTEVSVSDAQRELLGRHVEFYGERLDQLTYFPSIHFPLLAHEAVTGGAGPAVPVAAACTLVFLGADLHDTLADDEVPDVWDAATPAEIVLAATTIIATLPTLSVARLAREGVDPRVVWALTETLARGTLAMSAGQQRDIAPEPGDRFDPAAYRAVAELKAGEEVAMFGRAGAILAGAAEDVVDAYAGFGRCLGAAGQIATDATDLTRTPSQDLLTGKRTLPIAHALRAADGAQRVRLLALLEQARRSPDCHPEVLDELVRAGSFRFTSLVIEAYRAQAMTFLDAARPIGQAGKDLREMTHLISLARSGAGGPD